MKERNHLFDIIKGIAVLMVVITHFAWKDSERLRYLFPFWLCMAVPLFMIISGYFAAASYEKKGINNMMQAYDKTILVQKFLRYTIPFLFAYAVDVVCHTIEVKSFNIKSVMIFFLRGGFGGAGTYYYPILLQFIFVFPILYFIIKRYKNGLWICLLLNIVYEILVQAYMVNGKCYRMLIFRFIFIIAYGCYLYQNQGNKLGKKNWILFWAGITFVLATDYFNYTPITVAHLTRTCVYAVLFLVPLFSLAMKYCGNMRCRVLELLGNASYHIFFVQMLYYSYWDKWVGDLIPNRLYHLLVNIIICTLSGIVFFIIETPFSRFVLKKTNIFLNRKI